MYSEDQIACLNQTNFAVFNFQNRPLSLFKYFPNNTFSDDKGNKCNYSLDALKNNTVFLSAPCDFDDPYDCNIYVNYEDFALHRIRYYAAFCGVNVKQEWNYDDVAKNLALRIYEHISQGNSIQSLGVMNSENKLVKAHQEVFLLTLEVELTTQPSNGESYYIAINKVIKNEFDEMQGTANRFRVACFAQTPYSMLMWSHYAKYHQGFCIEYETPNLSDENIEIYQNLFPVIYTDTRTDLTKLSLDWKSSGTLSESDIWDFYKYCLLSKSLDWKYQQEWRLISCDDLLTDAKYNCKFFKIKKVYLGNKMPIKDRMEVIEICKSKGIPYTGVTIAPDQFNMRDCDILCEDCERMKQSIKWT